MCRCPFRLIVEPSVHQISHGVANRNLCFKGRFAKPGAAGTVSGCGFPGVPIQKSSVLTGKSGLIACGCNIGHEYLEIGHLRANACDVRVFPKGRNGRGPPHDPDVDVNADFGSVPVNRVATPAAPAVLRNSLLDQDFLFGLEEV